LPDIDLYRPLNLYSGVVTRMHQSA